MSKYYIGIDIGGMSIKAGVVDENGKILEKRSCVTRAKENYTVIVEDMYNLCKEVIEVCNLTETDIEAVGIGCPGTVDSKRGMITFAANLNFNNVDNTPIAKETIRKYIQILINAKIIYECPRFDCKSKKSLSF